MEQIRIGTKNWVKSIIKPFVFQEIIDDIKKLFYRIWSLKFGILVFVLFCMVLHLYLVLGQLKNRMEVIRLSHVQVQNLYVSLAPVRGKGSHLDITLFHVIIWVHIAFYDKASIKENLIFNPI